MLHSLLTEIVRRHLWPIPLIAVAVAIAAPLLFLKSVPIDTPSAAAPAPPVASEGRLPARAERLLATSDAGGPSDAGAPSDRRGAARPSHDPFAPPPGPSSKLKPAAEPTKAETTPKSSSTTESTPSKPVPVLITNADGSLPQAGRGPAGPIAGDHTTPSPLTVSSATVDVRFGEKVGAPLRREIARLQTFVAGANIVAVFVKYSPNRDKAVFAISPSTLVSGDVECRRKQGVCRYVDIPVGQHARLTWRLADGTVMSRRLDVVRVHADG